MADKFLTDAPELASVTASDLWLHVVDQNDVSSGNLNGTLIVTGKHLSAI